MTVITREWLKNEIENLSELIPRAQEKLRWAQRCYDRAAEELSAAREDYESLTGVRNELVRELERYTEKENAEKKNAEGTPS
jgi:chromosome segregation ATPase